MGVAGDGRGEQAHEREEAVEGGAHGFAGGGNGVAEILQSCGRKRRAARGIRLGSRAVLCSGPDVNQASDSAGEVGQNSVGRRVRRRRIWGVVLLGVAALALLERHTALRPGDAMPLLLGVTFLGWSIAARSVGLLIPGGILTGIGSGILVQKWLGAGPRDGVFLLCFAAGWVLIPLVAGVVMKRRVLWPMIPATVMTLTGLGQLNYPGLANFWREIRDLWPYGLIAVALALLLIAPKEK